MGQIEKPVRKTSEKCALGNIPEIGSLPEDIRREIEAICKVRHYKAGQTVSEIGIPSEYTGIVREGILRMQKPLSDGRQHVVGLLVEGDLFGGVLNNASHFAIEAATDAEIYSFRRAPFEMLLSRSAELERIILLNVLTELDRARDWMIILANPKVRGRIAGFLLMLCTRFQTVDHLVEVSGGSIRVRIPISRTDLANLLGTRPETISRALHSLADDGLIEILRPDLVIARRLEALADEAGDPELAASASLQRLMHSRAIAKKATQHVKA